MRVAPVVAFHEVKHTLALQREEDHAHVDTHELAVPHRDPAVVERRGSTRSSSTIPTRTLAAVKRLRGEGFDVGDVHSPFPVHGMEEALGPAAHAARPGRRSSAGSRAGSLKLLFQSWVHIVDWPMNIGGKPDISLPALVPVTFELTVLVAAFATLGALFVRRRLYPRPRPERAPRQPHPRRDRRPLRRPGDGARRRRSRPSGFARLCVGARRAGSDRGVEAAA